MRKFLIALAALVAVSTLGCALPQNVAIPTPPAPPPIAVPAGPGGLSVAAVPCPPSSPYLFCVGVLP